MVLIIKRIDVYGKKYIPIKNKLKKNSSLIVAVILDITENQLNLNRPVGCSCTLVTFYI